MMSFGEIIKRIGVAAGSILVVGLVFVGLAGYGAQSWHTTRDWIIRSASLIVALVIIAYSLVKKRLDTCDYGMPDRRSQDFDGPSLTSEMEPQVRELQAEVAALPIEAAENAVPFLLAILRPRDVRLRVAESYESEGSLLIRKVSIAAKLPRELFDSNEDTAHDNESARQPKTIPFPVIEPAKGELVDNLEVCGPDKKNLSILTHREYLTLAALSLRALLAQACECDPGRLPRLARIAERRALAAIIYPHGGSDTALAERSLWAVNLIENLAVSNAGADARTMAATLTSKLAMNYAIVVKVEPSPIGNVDLNYVHTTAMDGRPPVRLSTGGWQRIVNSLRAFLGARPIALTLSVEGAWDCQSFHLQIAGPKGTYLAQQTPMAWPDRGTDDHVEYQPLQGQPNGHLYTRDFPTPANVRSPIPEICFEFLEVPPGSISRAAIAAVTSLILIVTAGWTSTHGDIANVQLVAILLTFPAFAAAWLGAEAPAAGLVETTLAAKLSLIATVALSVWAMAWLVIRNALDSCEQKPCPDDLWYKLPKHLSILGITDRWWALIAFLALLNTMIVGYIGITRFFWYRHILSK